MADGFASIADQYAGSTYALREYLRSIRPIVLKATLRSLLTAIEAGQQMQLSQDTMPQPQVIEQIEQLRADIVKVIEAPGLLDVSTLKKYIPASEDDAERLISNSLPSLRELAVAKAPPLVQLAQPAKRMLVSLNHAQLLHESALIAAVTYFETLVAKVLTLFYHLRPQALSGEDKVLSFNELKGFGDIEQATSYVVSERVTAQMRGCIEDWRAFFRKQLKVEFTDQDSWEALVEVYQRRNVVVHNSSIVNRTYLDKVSPEIVDKLSPPPKLDAPLQTWRPYLDEAIELMTITGLALVDECWQRLLPDDLQARDQALIEAMNDTLFEPDWSLLKRVCLLLLKRPAFSESNRLVAQVNCWLAEKRMGNWERVKDKVMRFDLRACHPVYSMCVCSLLEDAEGFFRCLPMAVAGGVSRQSLETWPILDEVRSDRRFSQCVSELFPNTEQS